MESVFQWIGGIRRGLHIALRADILQFHFQGFASASFDLSLISFVHSGSDCRYYLFLYILARRSGARRNLARYLGNDNSFKERDIAFDDGGLTEQQQRRQAWMELWEVFLVWKVCLQQAGLREKLRAVRPGR